MTNPNLMDTDLGNYLRELRQSRGMSLKDVSDQLGIDFSMLSKIEHGERQLQSHMIAPIADLFEIDFKSIQIKYLNQKIECELGKEPFLIESLTTYINGKENKRQRSKA